MFLFLAESERDIEEDAGNYECNGDRGTSIRQNGDHREPVSFMVCKRLEILAKMNLFQGEKNLSKFSFLHIIFYQNIGYL